VRPLAEPHGTRVATYAAAGNIAREERRDRMLWTLIVLLLVFWLLGFAFNVAGGIIHVLLVIALVLFLVNFITGRRTVV
jgi:uncharacterized protein DUF5670